MKSPAFTTDPLHVVVHNTGAESRSIYWINFDGKRVPFGVVKSGGSSSFNSFLGHPWLIANAVGACESIYLPRSDVILNLP